MPSVDVTRVLELPAAKRLAERGGKALRAEEAEAVLEIAYLTTAANGDLADEEAEAFQAIGGKVRALAGQGSGAPLSRGETGRLFDEFVSRQKGVDRDERLKTLAKSIEAADARALAYQVSFAIALCDLETGDDEVEFDDELRAALEVGDRAEALAAEVYSVVDAGDDE